MNCRAFFVILACCCFGSTTSYSLLPNQDVECGHCEKRITNFLGFPKCIPDVSESCRSGVYCYPTPCTLMQTECPLATYCIPRDGCQSRYYDSLYNEICVFNAQTEALQKVTKMKNSLERWTTLYLEDVKRKQESASEKFYAAQREAEAKIRVLQQVASDRLYSAKLQAETEIREAQMLAFEQFDAAKRRAKELLDKAI